MSTARIIQRVQTLWSDQGETWCDKDYVQGFLAINNEDLESLLQNLDLSYDTDVIVLPAVPANTSDLSAYQEDGQPLDMMMLPIALEYRLIGETDEQWKPVRPVDKVLETSSATTGQPTSSQTSGLISWEWRKGIIYISPSSVDVDIRIRCDDLPTVLDTDSANYIKGMTNVLAYGVAEMIAWDRGGPAAKYAPYFKAKYDDAVSNIEDRLVKQEQTITRRMGGRRSRVGGPLWRTPTG